MDAVGSLRRNPSLTGPSRDAVVHNQSGTLIPTRVLLEKVGLSDDGWARPGEWTLKVPPAEICLLSQAWALVGGPRLLAGLMLPGKVTGWHRDSLLLARVWILAGGEKLNLGTLLFLVRTETIICFSGGLHDLCDLTMT